MALLLGALALAATARPSPRSLMIPPRRRPPAALRSMTPPPEPLDAVRC